MYSMIVFKIFLTYVEYMNSITTMQKCDCDIKETSCFRNEFMKSNICYTVHFKAIMWLLCNFAYNSDIS